MWPKRTRGRSEAAAQPATAGPLGTWTGDADRGLRRGWPLRALTSLREGKRSVPESQPLSPSWESRDSWPGEQTVYTRGGTVAWGSACGAGRRSRHLPSFPGFPQVRCSTPGFRLPEALCPVPSPPGTRLHSSVTMSRTLNPPHPSSGSTHFGSKERQGLGGEPGSGPPSSQ